MYNYDVNGIENNKEELLSNVYLEQDLPYWKERNYPQEEYIHNKDHVNFSESLRNSSNRFNKYASQKLYHDKNSDFMNTNQIASQSVKISDLVKELEIKNSEILSLNFKIQELEKTRNEMLIDLESYETEFQIAEKKFIARENELSDKLQISELEKNNLLNKLDYYQQMYPILNSNHHISNEMLIANRKATDGIKLLNEKIDLFYEFYTQLESLLTNKNSQKIVLQNLDCFALKFRFNQIIETMKNKINIKNEAERANLNNEMLNNENKSQKEITKRKSQNIQANFEKSAQKELKEEAPLEPKKLEREKSTFTPPDLDVNITIDSIKTNNNMVTDVNKIKEKANESLQKDKKSINKIQEEKKDDGVEKTEKLLQTVSLLSDKMTKIEEFIIKQAKENEKSFQKAAEGSRIENKSKSGASQGSIQRKTSKHY